MKFVSFNVNGIRAILKKDFQSDFERFNADVFAIQESKYSEDLHLTFPFEPDGYEVYWTVSKVRKGYSGVTVYTRRHPLSVHYGLLDEKYDEEGRVITLEFDSFYFVAAYVPNAGDGLKRMDFRLGYENDLIAYLSSLEKRKPIIYAGDLNVAHKEIDIKNPKANEGNPGYTPQERDAFTNLLSKGYVDTFRYLHPDEVKYSWWSYRFNSRANNAGWRIDYFLVSDCLKEKIRAAEIHNDVFGSDHCPISLEIEI